MTWPTHQDPLEKKNEAHAPYNFVPLPETVVTVDDLPDHDQYYPERYTGHITCNLTTLTPLYTRCMMTPEFFEQFGGSSFYELDADQKNARARFFHLDDIEKPVIPGSSLRGMTRNLVEIIAYGKLQWTTEEKLFFRTVDTSTVGVHYRQRMVGKVEAGFLHQRGSKYVIKPCHMYRVHRKLLGQKKDLYDGSGPNSTPRWNAPPHKPHQYKEVWVELKPGSKGVAVEAVHYKDTPGTEKGILVLTGDAPRKGKEFVFVPNPGAKEIDVDEKLIKRFHDDDQISQWQERAFSMHKPHKNGRQRDGMLNHKNVKGAGDPIFFLREHNQVTFFGRAQMFRLPYHQSPVDLVPETLHRDKDVDLAEAIFGYVRARKVNEKQAQTLAGRVFFTDAHFVEAEDGLWLNSDQAEDPANVITPKVLSGPKATSFQHYLTQQNPDNSRKLNHFGSATPGQTVLRGHKLYWHQNGDLATIEETDRHKTDKFYKQYSRIQPVKPKVVFSFKIHFENLSQVELGALLWALDLPDGHHHKLGMGKPLGLGSVKIEPHLFISQRDERYATLFDDTGKAWVSGYPNQENDINEYKRTFEQHIVEQLGSAGALQGISLTDQNRIQALLHILNWANKPPQSATKYMELSQFRYRPVLPTPQGVVGKQSSVVKIKPDPSKSAAQPAQTLTYPIRSEVKAKITGKWKKGRVPVELENGETGYLKESRKTVENIQSDTFTGVVVDYKNGVYFLKLP